MGFVVLVVAAFCIGAAGVYGIQYFGLLAIKQSLYTSNAGALPVKTVVPMSPLKFDAARLRPFTPPKLDPSIGKKIPVGTFNRQIDLHIRAGNMVPRPPSIPRVPVFRRR